MYQAIMAMALTGAIGLGAAVATQAAQTARDPEFVGTPSVRYTKVTDDERRFYSLAAVARLDRSIEPNQTAFPAAPELRTGQEIGEVFGGNPPSRIGDSSKHCYIAELQRPRPVATPQQGARWQLGISQDDTVKDTVAATLKRPESDSDWQAGAARRLGCYESSRSDRTGQERSIGRLRVDTDILPVFQEPAKIYLGSLQEGESMQVRKYSASGKYAYGFAYGDADKTGWVLASGLEQR
jgi:hypothetical protein